ncbi:MAG: hypothetical protein QMD99_23185 [Rhizobiaceae bacterium]|nr:hypothetical protein [Rhizobiaceae bacterium]
MDAFLFRLKAAQFDLIEACCGIERAAEKCGYGKTTVGRWKDRNDPTVMPIPAVVALEADCGRAFVTAVMAGTNGRRITDPEDEKAKQAGILSAHADLMQRMASLAGDVATAYADGVVSPTEAHIIDRGASEAERSLSDFRNSIAVVKAAGGERGGLKIVGEGD